MSRSTYREVLRRRSVRELLKFSVVGVGSAALDKGSLWLLLQRILPGTAWGISATLSFSLGVINGFLWNRHWTFRAGEHGSLGMQFFRFLSTGVVGLLLNLGATRTVFLHRDQPVTDAGSRATSGCPRVAGCHSARGALELLRQQVLGVSPAVWARASRPRRGAVLSARRCAHPIARPLTGRRA